MSFVRAVRFLRYFGTYYKADTLGKRSVGRKGVKDVHNTLEGSRKLSILSSEFMKGACPLFKEGANGVHRIARFELCGKRMVSQFGPSLFFVIL